MLKKGRIARVAEGMEKTGLDQIIVTSPASIYYLTEVWAEPGYRMEALLIDRSGACTLYANRIFALAGTTGDLPLIEFDDVDDCVGILADGLKPGTLGVDKLWAAHFVLELMTRRGDVRMVNGSAPVDEARMFKDAEEIARMTACSRLNDKIVGMMPGELREGITELQLGQRYIDLARENGAVGASFTPLICFGGNGSEPHHDSDNTPLRRGDAVIIDVGLKMPDRSVSDMTRTVFFGRPTDEQKRVYDLVKAANAAGRAAARPGIPLCEIDRAARSVIEEAGYGRYFTHRTGHNIGLQVHEPPDVSAASRTVARPGMMFSIEPGIYLKERGFGVRIEDLVVVTEDGSLTLNQLPREMIVL